MPDATTQKKFSCPACGGEAQWNPAKKALICPFCGATSPAQAELTASRQTVTARRTLDLELQFHQSHVLCRLI